MHCFKLWGTFRIEMDVLPRVIDAIDSPPSSCGVDLVRDCEGGCIVSAIGNYVSVLLPEVSSF